MPSSWLPLTQQSSQNHQDRQPIGAELLFHLIGGQRAYRRLFPANDFRNVPTAQQAVLECAQSSCDVVIGMPRVPRIVPLTVPSLLAFRTRANLLSSPRLRVRPIQLSADPTPPTSLSSRHARLWSPPQPPPSVGQLPRDHCCPHRHSPPTDQSPSARGDHSTPAVKPQFDFSSCNSSSPSSFSRVRLSTPSRGETEISPLKLAGPSVVSLSMQPRALVLKRAMLGSDFRRLTGRCTRPELLSSLRWLGATSMSAKPLRCYRLLILLAAVSTASRGASSAMLGMPEGDPVGRVGLYQAARH